MPWNPSLCNGPSPFQLGSVAIREQQQRATQGDWQQPPLVLVERSTPNQAIEVRALRVRLTQLPIYLLSLKFSSHHCRKRGRGPITPVAPTREMRCRVAGWLKAALQKDPHRYSRHRPHPTQRQVSPAKKSRSWIAALCCRCRWHWTRI